MPRPAPTKEQLIKRFLDRVDRTGTCWLWLGPQDIDGYGVFYTKGGGRAHRVSFQLFKEPIPHLLHVLHSCDNPSCVNPDHLFLGTNQDNVDDKMRKGRHKWRPRVKLTDTEVGLIRKSTGSQSVISRKFGVNQSTVCRIRAGKRRPIGGDIAKVA